jgi:glycosyltransferase involved in cell wall biosynthesis
MTYIYHFILDHRIGGPHIYVDNIKKTISCQFNHTVITTSSGKMTDIALLNLRHIWPPLYMLEVLINVFYILRFVLLGRIKRKDSIFHVHGAANIAPLVARSLMKIPTIWHIHETTPSHYWFVSVGKIFTKPGKTLIAAVAIRSISNYQLRQAIHLPALVDFQFWNRREVTKEEIAKTEWADRIDRKNQELRILTIGNLNPIKGIDILLESLRSIKSRWHLIVVGAELKTHKKYAAKLREISSDIMSSNKKSSIDFVGWKENHEIRALLATCDVFVLSSRSEACPTVLLEAAAMGCYCISANVGDASIILANIEDAKIFPVESIADCVKYLQEAIQKSKKPRVDVRSKLGSNWSAEHVVLSVAEQYKNILI